MKSNSRLSSQFNQNKFLFNLNNVTYDLKKFLIKNQDYKDYITLKSNIIYDLKSKCPLWQKFLQEITMEDQELQTYLQKLCGYYFPILCLFPKFNSFRRYNRNIIKGDVASVVGFIFQKFANKNNFSSLTIFSH